MSVITGEIPERDTTLIRLGTTVEAQIDLDLATGMAITGTTTTRRRRLIDSATLTIPIFPAPTYRRLSPSRLITRKSTNGDLVHHPTSRIATIRATTRLRVATESPATMSSTTPQADTSRTVEVARTMTATRADPGLTAAVTGPVAITTDQPTMMSPVEVDRLQDIEAAITTNRPVVVAASDIKA